MINLVRLFYEDPDISREMPGHKDYVSVKINNVKEHKQKMLLLFNLSAIYKQFKIKYPHIQIGFNKFASL